MAGSSVLRFISRTAASVYLLVAFGSSEASEATTASDGQRPFGVRDSIEMAEFHQPGIYSPDGRYFVTVTQRGLLPQGVTEASIWLVERSDTGVSLPAFGTLKMSLRVHLAVEYAHDVNRCWYQLIVNCMPVDEQRTVTLAHIISLNAQLGVGGEGIDRRVELIEILVRLHVVPLFEAVFPNTDEIAFSTGV
jgi:hypothetical protein